MYTYIVDPKTKSKISIFSKKGKNLLKRYIKKLNGGAKKIKKKNYFIDNNTLNNKQKKYCRCVLHVAKKNSKECNEGKNWIGRCYNPYAVCAKTTKTSTGSKPCQYNFKSEDIPDEEIEAYLQLNSDKFNNWALETGKETINESKSIDNLRENLNSWYTNKYNF